MPDGYVRAGERHGLTLEPARYEAARDAALSTSNRHPELEHDEEIWVAFTERIVLGMGGEPTRVVRLRRRDHARLGAARELRALRRRPSRRSTTSAPRAEDRARLELGARRARVRPPPRARRRRGHQLVPPRQDEAARVDLPRRARPARGRAGGGGDGRRHDRRRHRGSACDRDARGPPRPARRVAATSSRGSRICRSSPTCSA